MFTFTIALLALIAGYFFYGKFVEKIFGVDPVRKTPAYTKQDGVDYIPMPTWKIFMIQFLNIAGLGPIFGAIMGAKFGTASYLWIVLGSIFAGAVHDFLAGMISLRNGGESLPETIGRYLGVNFKQFMRGFTVLLMVLGLILLIHPDSASALVAQILGWVLVIAGVVFAVSAVAGHFDTLGKVLSAVCCFAVGAWLLRNPLMLAAGLGRLAGILLVVRGIQDILNASRYHYGILPAVITTVLGAVLIALPMTTSRVVISLCGLLVLIVGIAILVDRLRNRRPKEPAESDIIDAL